MSSGPTVLALGGGGARGLAHVGVIEVLLEEGIPIDRIVGVSVGSVIGSIYAFEADIQKVRSVVVEYLTSEEFQQHQRTLYGARKADENGEASGMWFSRMRDFIRANRLFNRVITKPSLLGPRFLRDIVEAALPDADIAESKVPLTIVAVDLKTGNKVVLEQGPLRDSVRGSAALPGIFPAVDVDGRLLADIGIFCALPTQVCRYYSPENVIAVDVSPEIGPVEDCETALDVMMRMEEISGTVFQDHVLSLADVVIRPEVGHLEWSDFSTVEKIIDEGRDATIRAMPAIRKRVQQREIRAASE